MIRRRQGYGGRRGLSEPVRRSLPSRKTRINVGWVYPVERGFKRGSPFYVQSPEGVTKPPLAFRWKR